MSNARWLPSLLVSIGATLVACGGAESSGATPDAALDVSPDEGRDTGSDDTRERADAPTDAPTDSPADSPAGRVPKDHRPAATTCAPSKGGGGTACGGGGFGGACKADGDCTAGTNGHCAVAGGGAPRCACFYDTCANDGDCATVGGPCACQGSAYETYANDCAPGGNCKVDADCGAGGYCSPSGAHGCTGGLAGYFCHVPADECVDDSDCKATTFPQACTFDKAKAHWACVEVPACA